MDSYSARMRAASIARSRFPCLSDIAGNSTYRERFGLFSRKGAKARREEQIVISTKGRNPFQILRIRSE
jgi:hypothetical protein